LQAKKDVHIKITRPSAYGERYKLFEIKKGTFDSEFNLEKYGLNLAKKDNRIVVDTLDWNGDAKKSGFEMDDIITELKTENLDRPNKDVVYIFSLILLIIFGYFNHKEYRFKKNITKILQK
jgi:C-terminal processing protease CtpA/Prc